MLKYLKNKDKLLYESVVSYQDYKNKQQSVASPISNKADEIGHVRGQMSKI